MPFLNSLHEQWAQEGVVIIGLTDEGREAVEEFMRLVPMHYIVGVGSDSVQRYGVSGIPHAFLIDPSGQVVWSGHPLGGLDRALERALAANPPSS